MADIDELNAIVVGLGGDGGHVYTIDALNEWAALAGAAAGHRYNIDALNAIDGALGGSGAHTLNIDALNSIAAIQDAGGPYTLEVDALDSIGAVDPVPAEYAEWNPADKSAGILLSNDDKTAHHVSATTEGVRALHALAPKTCFALAIDNASGWRAGIATAAHTLDSVNLGAGTANVIITQAGTVFFNSGALQAYGATAQGGVLLVGYDDGKIWFGSGETWNGNPAAGTGAAKADVAAGEWFPVFGTTGVGPSGKVTFVPFPAAALPAGWTAIEPEPIPGGGHWRSAFHTNFSTDSNSWNATNFRQVLAAALITKGGTKYKLRLSAGSGEPFTYQALRAGHGATSGDAYDFDAADTDAARTVTVGAAQGTTIPAGTTIETDEKTYTIDDARNFVIWCYPNGGTSADQTRSGTLTNATNLNKAGASDAGAQDATGYSTTASTVRLVAEVLVFVP